MTTQSKTAILGWSASYGPARKVPHPTAHPARGEFYTSGVFPQGLAAPHALARAAPTSYPSCLRAASGMGLAPLACILLAWNLFLC